MNARNAIIYALAGSLIAPGAVYAWGNKTTQADQSPSAQSATGPANAREAVSDAAITTKVKAQLAKERTSARPASTSTLTTAS